MEEVNLRFQHISEQIFGCLDNESLANCQEVCRSWKNFLCSQKFLQARIIFETVKKIHKVGISWFQVFKNCNTKTITDLRIAVEQFYKELQTNLDLLRKSNLSINPSVDPLLAKNKELNLGPLHVAAGFGQLTLFNNILQKVDNKFPLDGLGRSTLHFAATNDCINIYESIVAINGNICPHSTVHPYKVPKISTPLDTAAFHNSINVCRFIVENNQDQIPWDKTSSRLHGWTPLHTAALKGHTAIYEIIMKKLTDKNPLVRGFSPLHMAALAGHVEMCKLIFENIGDKNPVGAHGKTPKDMARDMAKWSDKPKQSINCFEIVKLFS